MLGSRPMPGLSAVRNAQLNSKMAMTFAARSNGGRISRASWPESRANSAPIISKTQASTMPRAARV